IGIEPKVKVAVAGKKQRPSCVERQSRCRQLALPLVDMPDPGAPLQGLARPLRRLASSPATETEDVEQRVAHHSVAAVDPTSIFADAEQPRYVGCAITVYGNATVLVMQCRIDHERRLSRIEL